MSAAHQPASTDPPPITLEDYAKAMLNILQDSTAEKSRLEETQRAALNILDDFAEDRASSADTQRAMLNILDDFGEERSRVEAANRELLVTLQSLRVAKEQAEAASRELEAFAYSVSHDLRAPLRAMDGFSVALVEDYRDRLDGQALNYLERIRAASQRMAQLIDDLLQLSRVTRGEMRRGPVDLSALAQAVAAELREMQPERCVEFVVTDSVTAEGDARLLQLALRNLLANAWKFTSKHPIARIEFGSVRQDGRQVFYVRDDGAGFEMAYVDKLFGVFQRLHSAENFAGTGIGLATVQRIIQRHGGRVWAEGAPEEGATFYFTLQ